MNETFNNCPKCHCTYFVKAGLGNGKQRYKCKGCNHYFSVKQRSNQKSNDIKKQAIDMYLEGLGFRSIGRVLNISYGTVYQWVKQLGKQHQIRQDTNQTIDIVELDEIHSYTKHKKTIAGLGLPLTETVNKS